MNKEIKVMSKYYSISGRVELYDFEKFRDWLFEELQKQDFVGTFDIGIDKETENLRSTTHIRRDGE